MLEFRENDNFVGWFGGSALGGLFVVLELVHYCRDNLVPCVNTVGGVLSIRYYVPLFQSTLLQYEPDGGFFSDHQVKVK